MQNLRYLIQVLRLTRPYRGRLILGILCGVLAGLSTPMFLASIKLAVDTLPSSSRVSLADQVRNAATPTFALEEIAKPEVLLASWMSGSNALARHFWEKAAPATRRVLAVINDAPSALREAMMRDLNATIYDPKFFQPERFAGIHLSKDTLALAAEPASSTNATRLNRLLLEESYPGALRHSMKTAGVVGWLAERLGPLLRRIDPQSSVLLTVLAISTLPLAMLFRGAATYLNTYLMNWVSLRTIFDLRTRLFGHLLTLSASFFNKISTGELISRFTEVQMLQGILSNSLVTIIRDPITLVSLLVLLLREQRELTLVAMIVLPVTVVPFFIFARRMRKASKQMYAQYADLGKLLHETFTGYRVVKAYNLESKLTEEYRKNSRAAVGLFMRMLRSMELPGPMIEFFGAVGMAAFFIYLALYGKDKTTGDLLMFAGAIFMMYAPIKSLIRLHAQLQQANAASQFIFHYLETPSSVVEPAQPKSLSAAGQPVRFEHVDFAYDEKSVLHDFDLVVKPGQLVALVGSSGSGKTTATSLLLRFYDPTKGVIRIGDTDIRDVTTGDLRRSIGVVTQETVLFNDTIKNNIALGRPGATDEEIILAAKHAHAHDFIVAKPQGYDTEIGEKGVQLSGGQRQRLAIARAILKGAPILVLDEATSALDTESERAVQAALDDLMEGRTTICIAHRLSTIHHADVIVVMDQGCIVETGRHEELIRRGGIYQRLYELQFRSAPTPPAPATAS